MAGSTIDCTGLDDASLISLIARSQADALGELYDRYSRLVYSLALNTVGDGPTAKEITLDTFERVWESASTYRADRAKVSTWLTSIARHRAIDEQGYGVLWVSSPAPLFAYDAVGVTIEPAGGSPGPTGAKVLARAL